MVFRKIEGQLGEREAAFTTLSPVRKSLHNILLQYGTEKKTDFLDYKLRGWNKIHHTLKVNGSFWRDSKEWGRTGESIFARISDCPHRQYDLEIEVKTRNITMKYLLAWNLEESCAEMSVGEQKDVTWGWKTCAEDLPQLVDWLKETLE